MTVSTGPLGHSEAADPGHGSVASRLTVPVGAKGHQAANKWESRGGGLAC